MLPQLFFNFIIYVIVAAFDQDQHIGPSDRFVDDSLVCKPSPIVS